MKQLTLIIGLIMVLVSCEEATNKAKSTGYTYGSESSVGDLQIITYDGCEYIGNFGGNSENDWGTHKGNCSNPIHKQNVVTVYDTVLVIRK